MEKKPKSVHAEQWSDFAGVRDDPALFDEFYQLIQCIERGDGAPERYYRAGIDRDRDGPLDEQGIMHLHIGGRNSDVLVFLIQYADRVVLLESNTHVHFRTQPAGKNILALLQSWLVHLEREMQEAADKARTAAEESERQEAEARRGGIAASIAAFRAKADSPRNDSVWPWPSLRGSRQIGTARSTSRVELLDSLWNPLEFRGTGA